MERRTARILEKALSDRGRCKIGIYRNSKMKPSPDHGRLRLHNDDDDEDSSVNTVFLKRNLYLFGSYCNYALMNVWVSSWVNE